MTVVPNPQFLDGETPTVTLAGIEWPIPFLTPRQQKHVLPALFELIPVLVAMQSSKEQSLQAIRMLDTKSYDLLIKAVYWGLKKAHPILTIEQFEDMDVTPAELISALKVVSDQTGVLKVKSANGIGDPLGEAQAAGTA